MPKQLLKIGGLTILGRLLLQLVDADIKEFLFSVPSTGSDIPAEIEMIFAPINGVRAIMIETCGTKAGDLVQCLARTEDYPGDVCIVMGDLVIEGRGLQSFLKKGIPPNTDFVLAYTLDSSRSCGVQVIGDVSGLTRESPDADRFAAAVHLANVRGRKGLVDSWDGEESSMSALLTIAFKIIRATSRELVGITDVNTPDIYEELLLKEEALRNEQWLINLTAKLRRI